MKRIVLFGIMSIVFGCAGAKSQKREDAKRFPTRTEIVKLMQEKQPDYLKDKVPGEIVDTWTLKGELPTMIGEMSSPAKNAAEKALESVLASMPKHKMTDALNCVAVQNAEFLAVYGKLPFDSLSRFIAGRCGSQNDSPYLRYRVMPAGASTEEFQKSFLRSFKTKAPVNHGVGVIQKDEKQIVVLAYGYPGVTLEPIALQAPKNGIVEIKGTYLRDDANRFAAQFTVGEFGFKSCEKQPAESPAFFFICKFSPADIHSKLELAYGRENAVYDSVIVKLMIFPKLTNIYSPPTSRRILRAAKTRSKDFKSELLYIEDLVNRVRTSGGSHAITLAKEQNQIVQNLTASFFNTNDSSEETNKALLSMLAGWEVDGEVINTEFRSGYVDGENAIRTLEAVLESPGGRKTLLGPKVNEFAVGVLKRKKHGSAYIFVSYNFLKEQHINKRISRVMKSLRKERKKRGLSPPKELTQYRTNAAEWAKEFREGATFESISNKMIDVFRNDYGSSKPLWFNHFSVSDLDDLNFSEETINEENLTIMLVVTPYRTPGSPRTFFAVFYVYET